MSGNLQFAPVTSSSCILPKKKILLSMDDFSSFLVSNRPFARGYVIICNFTLIITGYYIHYLGLQNDSLFYHSYIAHPQRGQSFMLWKQELSFCSCY